MNSPSHPVAVDAADVPSRGRPALLPEPFASRLNGRGKRALGDVFGLRNFGVNLVRLAPGAASSIRHAHTLQDEFVFVIEGHPTLMTDAGATPLAPGHCAGFRAGSGDAHCLVNETAQDVVYLEVGDRTAGDQVDYPDDDLKLETGPGGLRFVHKDGSPFA